MTDTHPLIVDGPIAVLVPRDIVTASGPEAETFLQGQVSQDVAALDTGASAWSFILQPQGKVDAWFRVTRTAPDSFVLDIDAGHGDAVVERLNRFKLRTRVDFEQHSWEMLAVRGAASGFQATAQLTAAPEWPGMAGVDLLGPAGTTGAEGFGRASPQTSRSCAFGLVCPPWGRNCTEILFRPRRGWFHAA